MLTSPSFTTSALPLPKTRVSSGASSRFLSTAAFWVVDASAIATSFESNRRLLGTSLDLGQTRLLVDPHQVSCGVTKRGHDLTGVLVNGFNDLAAGRDDGVNCKGRAGDHDVDHQAGSGRDRPPEDPGAADLADGVVERRRAVPSLSNMPAEGAPVELGRLLDVVGRNLDVADLARPVSGPGCWYGHTSRTEPTPRCLCGRSARRQGSVLRR